MKSPVVSKEQPDQKLQSDVTADDGTIQIQQPDPRLFRQGRREQPKSAAGGEVRWMKERAQTDPDAERSRRDVLHSLDFGISARQVRETASFPDGRIFEVNYTEYNISKLNPASRRPTWKLAGETRINHHEQ